MKVLSDPLTLPSRPAPRCWPLRLWPFLLVLAALITLPPPSAARDLLLLPPAPAPQPAASAEYLWPGVPACVTSLAFDLVLGNAQQLGSTLAVLNGNGSASSCLQGAMLWAAAQAAEPANAIAAIEVTAASQNQSTAQIIAAALSSSASGLNVTISDLMTNNTAKVAQAIQSSNIAKLTAAVKSTDPTRSFVQDSISDSVSTGLDMAAMGADLTLVSAAIANNISAAVRLAAIDIGGLSAQGTNGVILGGPDALAAAAIICGLDIRNYTSNALAEVAGENATQAWQTYSSRQVFAQAMAPTTGFQPFAPQAELAAGGRRLQQSTLTPAPTTPPSPPAVTVTPAPSSPPVTMTPAPSSPPVTMTPPPTPDEFGLDLGDTGPCPQAALFASVDTICSYTQACIDYLAMRFGGESTFCNYASVPVPTPPPEPVCDDDTLLAAAFNGETLGCVNGVAVPVPPAPPYVQPSNPEAGDGGVSSTITSVLKVVAVVGAL